MSNDRVGTLRKLWEPHCSMCGQLLGKMGKGSFVVMVCPKCRAENTVEVSDGRLNVNAMDRKEPAVNN